MTKSEFNSRIHTKDFFFLLEKRHNGNKTHMANELGTSRASLNRWINKVNGKSKRSPSTNDSLRKNTVVEPCDKMHTDELSYDDFIKKLRENIHLPYSEIILRRCEGKSTRDKYLVEMVINNLKILYNDYILNIFNNPSSSASSAPNEQ